MTTGLGEPSGVQLHWVYYFFTPAKLELWRVVRISLGEAQAIDSWSVEGGIAKLACNGLSYNAAGEWLLPYWRELGGGQQCQKVPKLHGVAGVLITGDQVRAF